jgi:hypothetical protein
MTTINGAVEKIRAEVAAARQQCEEARLEEEEANRNHLLAQIVHKIAQMELAIVQGRENVILAMLAAGEDPATVQVEADKILRKVASDLSANTKNARRE